MTSKRPRSPSPKPPSQPGSSTSAQIWTSNPIEDRSSIFVAHFSPTITTRQLQSNPEFKNASHRIVASRKPSAQRSLSASSPKLYDTWHDDDGEKYAGKRLEKLLDAMQVEGAVVVARWYGGILLGPVRFTHIEKCAREAIDAWKKSGGNSDGNLAEPEAKRVKQSAEEEAEEQKKLATELVERDRSIEMLRKLLADKHRERNDVAEEENKPTASQGSSQKPKIDYIKMPLAGLRRLDKARDATIGFLLKEIDKAEKR